MIKVRYIYIGSSGKKYLTHERYIFLLKNTFTAVLVCVLLITSLATSYPFLIRGGPSLLRSNASSPVVNCLSSTVTVAVELTNVSCTEYGSVLVSGSGSITLVNSSLVLVGGGNYAQLNLTQSAKLVLVSSSISNASISLTGQSNLTANSGSLLTLENFKSYIPSVVALTSTKLVDNDRFVNLSSSTINVVDSTFAFSTPRALSFSANSLSILNSSIDSTNSSSLTFNGNSSLRISQTSIASILDTSLSNAVSSESISLSGGNVSIVSSNILSSGIAPSGYPPAGDSTINVTAAQVGSISSSNLTAGNTNEPITFKTSKLLVDSLRNSLTITNSFLQSLSKSPTIALSANSPPDSYLNIDQSTLEMQNATGLIQLSASYSVRLAGSKLDGSQSTLQVLTEFLLSNDSTISDRNVTQDLSFGFGLESGTFYNTTFKQCSKLVQSCLSVATQGGSYYIYGLMQVHVTSQSGSLSVANASVTAIDSRTGRSTYIASTNASGWAEMEPLLVQATFGTSFSIGSYIIQAAGGGELSAQEQVSSNQSIIAELSLYGNVSSLLNSNLATQSQLNISSSYGLSQYSFLFNPPNTYKLGTYIGSEYLPYITIMSNAVPLNYKNNASFSEIDFSTFGDSGGSFYFVVIYPNNFTSRPLALRVDGGYQSGVKVQSNSSDYFSIFSIPSGVHRIALVFNLRSGNSIPVDYPNSYPTSDVLITAGLLAVAAAIAISVYEVRRQKIRQT